jgi:hypothetical protein
MLLARNDFVQPSVDEVLDEEFSVRLTSGFSAMSNQKHLAYIDECSYGNIHVDADK